MIPWNNMTWLIFTSGLLIGMLLQHLFERPVHRKREATLKKYRDFLTELNDMRIKQKEQACKTEQATPSDKSSTDIKE